MSGDAYHAKYASNEIFNLVPAFADPEPGRDNPTITPIPGDDRQASFERLRGAAYGSGKHARTTTTARYTGLIAGAR